MAGPQAVPHLSRSYISRLRNFLPGALFALCMGAAAGCTEKKGGPPQNALDFVPKTSQADAPINDSRAAFAAVGDLPGTLLAQVDVGSFGPHLVRGADGWVVVWETPSGERAGWYSVYWPDSGAPEAALRLAEPSDGLMKLSVTAQENGEIGVLCQRRGGKNARLELMTLGPRGDLRKPPTLIADTPAAVLWVKAQATQYGLLALWAEQEGATAQLRAASVTGHEIGEPLLLAGGVHAWQIAAHAGSLGLLTLEGEPKKHVRLRVLGQDGRTLTGPTTLSVDDVTGGLDLDLVLTDKRMVAAWSEQRGLQTRVMGAVLDGSGKLRKRDVPLTVPRGNQALARLLADPRADEVWVVWDETDRRDASAEYVLGRLIADTPARAEARLRAESRDVLLPQFSLHAGVLTTLLELSLCTAGGQCTATRGAWVSGKGVTPQGALDLRTSSVPGGPSMLWDLTCDGPQCLALAADSADPTRVFGVTPAAGKLKSPFSLLDQPIRVESREVLSLVPELSALSGARNARGDEVVAWLSYFDPAAPYVTPNQPAPDGRRAPVRALLQTFAVDEPTTLPVRSSVISYRARSLGGVALVAPQGTGLLAWAALDRDDPQLFATVIDDAGGKVRQAMLTRTPGEVTDVAAVRTPGGYLIAWVDDREQTPEVWALSVDERLRGPGPVRLSHGAGQPSGVALYSDGDSVRVVWSDAREANDRGAAELFTTTVDAKTAEPRHKERRLTETKTHCHSPMLQRLGDGTFVLAWIEDGGAELTGRGAPGRNQGEVGRLMWASWDGGSGILRGTAAPDLSGAASHSVWCRDDRCGALVAAHRGPGQSRLWLSTFDAEGAPEAHPLGGAQVASPLAMVPLLLDDVAFVSERSGDADSWQISRLSVAW